MTDFSHLLQQGASHAWFFVPTAILLGALHGLEPGHSKTMMAAFIVAIRGTIFQAVLLGLAAAFSHTLIIWLLAAVALRYGGLVNAESTEPYFQIASALLILGMAAWMAWRTKRDVDAEALHNHRHAHGGKGPRGGVPVDTGHGVAEITVFEEGVPPVFRLYFYEHGKPLARLPSAETVTIETFRPDGTRQRFNFQAGDGYLESIDSIPEPHEFGAALTLVHGDHTHRYETQFSEEGHSHGHGHAHGHEQAHGHGAKDFQDAHEQAHARDIETRFAGRTATTGQIVMFGLTGGLMPCPAAFTILLLCLQVKRFALGMGLVLAFSAGLALTLVTVGALAAWSLRHAERRIKGFGAVARRLPYLSSALLAAMALFVGIQGWRHLAGH